MKKTFAILFCIALTMSECFSQTDKKFVGSWEGKLNAGVELTIVFHIKEDGAGGWTSTADSPDQSAFGLKCDTTVIHGSDLTIEMHGLNASFNGRIMNDSTIEGTFKQSVEIPLILYRKTGIASPVEVIPSNYYRAIDVTVQGKNSTLSGTCFQPLNDNKSLAVLIIAGSGPTDRDGNSALLPGKNNSLLQLADSLANYGIASLRYDKRGIGKSKTAAVISEKDITINDIAGDAAAMYDWLKTNGYKNIFIAGHSEGSLIGLMIAGNEKPKGFISLAGAGRKAGDILKEQVAGKLSDSLTVEFNRAIDSLEKGFDVKRIDPVLVSILRPSVQPYMRSWLKQDPQKLISELQCPVLILQGTSDLQIKETDAQNLKKAQPKATLMMIQGMNHVLKEIKSGKTGDNLKAYSDPSLPVAQPLIKGIVQFILQSK